MTTDPLEQFSEALADRLAAASRFVVAIRTGRRDCSGILWRDDVVVTSEQMMPEGPNFTVVHDGAEIPANLAGCDAGTNVAVLRLATKLDAALPAAAASPRPGSLALIVGADARGAPTGRLGMVHATGPEWHSQSGGRIDALLRLDARLGADEGGPVLTLGGRLHRHVHLRPAPARAGDPGRHHRPRARPAARPKAASPAAGSASGCSRCWCPSGCATRPAATPA